MHSGPFGWLTKHGAKRVKLVQKFVPGSRVGIFRNERTRSTPLVPKMMFWCVSYYLDSGPFGCILTLGAKRAELVQKFVPRSRIRIFRNERTRYTPLDPKLTFSYVSNYLGAFWAVWLPYETRCKTGRTSSKVRATKSRRIFSQRTLSTPLDPKLMFWCVSYYLGAFGTVWLPYETRCTTCRTSTKVRATKSRRYFLQRTHLIHPIDPKLTFWCISYYLRAF